MTDPFHYHAERPSFFPDGKRAFGDPTTGNGDINEVSINGGDLQRLVGGSLREGYPSISPDGKTIAYTVMRGDANTGQIFKRLVHADEGSAKPVPLTSGRQSDIAPSFSPDGRSILFARAKRLRPYSMGGQVWDEWDLWIMDADGANQRKLTDARYCSVDPPYFSPDGKQVLFAAEDFAGNAHQILVLHLKEGQPGDVRALNLPPPAHPNAFLFDGDPAYSPDGSRIAFISSRVSRPAPYDYEVWTANVDGSDLRQVTRNQAMNAFPRFSPDGKWIIFFSNSRREGPFELWRIHPDGSGLSRVSMGDRAK